MKILNNESEKQFVNLEKACEYLGLSKATLYLMTHKRTIPFYKPSHKLYFKLQDLENYVLNKSSYYPSNAEIEQKALDYLVSGKVSS